jgi:hypothetical protein
VFCRFRSDFVRPRLMTSTASCPRLKWLHSEVVACEQRMCLTWFSLS